MCPSVRRSGRAATGRDPSDEDHRGAREVRRAHRRAEVFAMTTKEIPVPADVLALVARGQELQAELDEIESQLAVVTDPDRAFELLERAKQIPTRLRALEISLQNQQRLARETNPNLY
jgi:hypothetical protein